MRKRIYDIIDQGHDGDAVSVAYEIVMLVAILVSIVPLMFSEETRLFRGIELVTVSFFTLDYVLRWITADYRLGKKGWSFVIYPFTGWAIIDILFILPGFQILWDGFKLFRVSRLMRILRVFKLFRYSEKIQVLGRAIRKEKSVLFTVLGISVFYVFLTALIMFNAEPHINAETGKATFETFFDALYWATVTLTTVGYGDVVPVTSIGRFVSMLSSVFGVAIIALPSGVITASYLEELKIAKQEKSNDEQRK